MGFLAIDIGNTNITTGYFPLGDLTETRKIPSSMDPPEYWSQIFAWLGGERFRGVQAIGVSSVVKDLETEILEALSGVDPVSVSQPPALHVITRDFPFPLKSAYQQGLLGTDRMLAAVAGAALFGKPVITVDIGSAVTIDLVDRKGVFRGGQILLGGGLRSKALAAFTSLLPEIPVPQSPPPLIGTNTVECLGSGIYHGMRAEIKGLVSKIQKEARTRAAVVLTGQGSLLFEESRPSGWQIEKFLVLKGIYYSCQRQDLALQE
ncbi:MAG: type III pantothenate kinase [Proteobacteria bacterium]|nr:type III pantothenate kinase [Pseudomonadota bacterium]